MIFCNCLNIKHLLALKNVIVAFEIVKVYTDYSHEVSPAINAEVFEFEKLKKILDDTIGFLILDDAYIAQVSVSLVGCTHTWWPCHYVEWYENFYDAVDLDAEFACKGAQCNMNHHLHFIMSKLYLFIIKPVKIVFMNN